MAKVVESVEVSLQMWANVSLSAEEIADIYPEFNDMTAGDDTEEMEQAIEEYMNMNYMDHVQYSDGALDECRIDVVWEDDGSE
jgi:hypothetical protein